MIRVTHLSVVRHLTPGQAKQLSCEIDVGSRIADVRWVTLALQSSTPTSPLSRRIPPLFRPMFLRNLYGWVTALRLSRECDYLLMRHMTFDPFAFIFAPMIRNRVSIHHSKEVDELRLVSTGWKGQAASFLEGLSGRVAVRHARMVAGVTREIAEYERAMYDPNKPVAVYANGVNSESITLLGDRRDRHTTCAAFICGTFADWQALDKLIAAVDAAAEADARPELKIYLIGRLSEKQLQEIAATPSRASVFVNCGFLEELRYRALLDHCHLGIGSLALERANLTEAATLKVREMLAMGLPVYSLHRDGSLPDDFPHYLNDDMVSISRLVAFARQHDDIGRRQVSEAARPFISKEHEMRRLCDTLQALSEPA